MSKRNLVIYVSGAYMGNDKGASIDSNIALARQAAIELWEKGYTCICPHLNTANFEVDCNISYNDYLAGDIEIIKRCDAVFALPNYKESKGADIEIREALAHNLPIFFLMSELEEYYESVCSNPR